MENTGNVGDLEKCRLLAFRSLWKQGYYVGEGNLSLNLILSNIVDIHTLVRYINYY